MRRKKHIKDGRGRQTGAYSGTRTVCRRKIKVKDRTRNDRLMLEGTPELVMKSKRGVMWLVL